MQRFFIYKRQENLIENREKAPNSSMLVNGWPTKEMSTFKGLRERDPLSPLLFMIVFKGLYMWFDESYPLSREIPIQLYSN